MGVHDPDCLLCFSMLSQPLLSLPRKQRSQVGQNVPLEIQVQADLKIGKASKATSEYTPKRIESRDSNRYLHTRVHGSIIQNS